jgi:hypothetical protein
MAEKLGSAPKVLIVSSQKTTEADLQRPQYILTVRCTGYRLAI